MSEGIDVSVVTLVWFSSEAAMRNLYGLLAVVAVAGMAEAADWPQWRGPARDGVADASGLPTRWPVKLKSAWRKKVGEGHSSPVVRSGRVYLLSRQGGHEVVRGFELESGRELWRSDYKAEYKIQSVARDHGRGPKATPVIAGQRLVTFGISGILSCWETATGRRAWSRDFAGQHREAVPLYGHAASPIVVDGKVIVHVGGHDDGALTAVDVASGKIAWRWAGDGPAYASPVLLVVDGKRQLVAQSQKFHLGVDPASGEVLWRVPFTTQFDQNSVTPLVAGGRVILAGYDQPTVALKVTARDGRLRTDRKWKNRGIAMYMSSPVLAGGRLFGMTHRRRGQLFCADPASGKVAWATQGRLAENAALIVAGDVLLVQTSGGELSVVAVDRTSHRELARYRLSESATWAHPALVGSRLLVKDRDHLLVFDLAG
jgi:outer membrane protein assembly factor BamB